MSDAPAPAAPGRHTLVVDELTEPIVGCVPVDNVDPVGQVAFLEGRSE